MNSKRLVEALKSVAGWLDVDLGSETARGAASTVRGAVTEIERLHEINEALCNERRAIAETCDDLQKQLDVVRNRPRA